MFLCGCKTGIMRQKAKKAREIIYLDNNASTPLAPEVASVMAACLQETFGNPSSSHFFGEAAKKTVEHARGNIADLIGASPEEIVFTSGGTEANNMAIMGTARRFKSGHIITSCTEHPSVLNPLKHLEGSGFEVTRLPVDRYGRVNPRDLEMNIKNNTILITIMHSNNETGTIQPIAELGRIARKKGITFHCDAAQSVGKIAVNVKKLRVDLLTVVPHKFYGPKGTGALYIKRGTGLLPIMFGASHEKALRPGTENTAGIAGFGKASEIAKKEMQNRSQTMKRLTKTLYSELRARIPGIKLNGHPVKRLPNTLNISFPGVSGAVLLGRLKDEIAASTGSACHEGRQSPSPVLKAMGLGDEEALASVRLSIGRNTTEGQIQKSVRAIVRAWQSLASESGGSQT